jgi:hypothetical protein
MTPRPQDGSRKETIMSNGTVNELRTKSEAAWERIGRQLAGMEAHLERTSAPGQWTAREVLCHLLFEPGFRPVGLLERFASTDLPLVEITPGVSTVTPERRRMTLAELVGALDSQRREVFAYLEALDEAALRRKARIPLFAPLVGTDEITLPVFVGAMFDRHWSAHADQLAQIRQAVGLPETR